MIRRRIRRVEEGPTRELRWQGGDEEIGGGQRRSTQWGGLTALLTIIIASLILAAHWPVLSATGLAFDDHKYVIENPLVQNPGWNSARRFLSEIIEPSTIEGYYQPLTMISLMFDTVLGGRPDKLMPYHRTSLALHVVNSLLVIVFLHLLFGELRVALMVGLLFGVHPLTVEPVAWLGERKTLLATFFALGSLILYVRWTRAPGRKSYGACLGLYVLALMSKPTAIPLPVLMLLLDYWPLGRLSRKALLEKLPLFALGAASAVITFLSQSRTAYTALPTEHGFLRPLFIVCHNVVFYLRNVFWPVDLSPHYSFPAPLTLSHPMVLFGVVGTCVLLIGLVISLRFTRSCLTGWLFFFLAGLPTMGIIGFTNVIAADKFVYLPMLGLLLVAAWLLAKAWCRRAAGNAGLFGRRLAILLLVVIVAAAEVAVTRRCLAYWQNTESLYRHMLASAPRAPVLHYGMGHFLQSEGRLEEALTEFRKAVRLVHDFPEAHHAIAICLLTEGRIDEAIRELTLVVRMKPEWTAAHNDLGLLLAKRGRHAGAAAQFTEVLKLDPDFPGAGENLQEARVSRSKVEEYMEIARGRLRDNPDDAEAHYVLGLFAERWGRFDEAIKEYEEVLRIDPDNTLARTRLDAVLSRRGEP